jgi:hypothetical protein
MPNNIVPAKERKFVVFESKLIELFQKECSVANINAPAIIKLPNGIVPENGWLLHLNG